MTSTAPKEIENKLVLLTISVIFILIFLRIGSVSYMIHSKEISAIVELIGIMLFQIINSLHLYSWLNSTIWLRYHDDRDVYMGMRKRIRI